MKSRAVPIVKSMIIQTLKKLTEDSDFFKDRIPAFILMGLKNLHLRIKFSSGEAEEILQSIMEDSGIRCPDAIDLIDFIGFAMSYGPFLDAYDNMPFVTALVDTLKEVGVAKVEFGLTHRLFTAGCQMKTEGVKEIFELTMNGMV